MAPEYQVSVRRGYEFLEMMKPKYKMDYRIKPDDPIEKGVDCSRYHYLAYRWAAVPGIQRVTSYDIAMGKGGWIGVDVKSLADIEDSDMVFWTWANRPDRPHGHTGRFKRTQDGHFQVAHASSGKGHIVVQDLTGALHRDITKIRRITIGDTPRVVGPRRTWN